MYVSVDSNNPMSTVDVLRSVRPVNSSKFVGRVDAFKPVSSVNFYKSVCAVN